MGALMIMMMRGREKAREEEKQALKNILGPLCASYAALPAQKEI